MRFSIVKHIVLTKYLELLFKKKPLFYKKKIKKGDFRYIFNKLTNFKMHLFFFIVGCSEGSDFDDDISDESKSMRNTDDNKK